MPARIDTHTHLVPPFYRQLLADAGIDSGGFPVPAWSAQAHLDLMDGHDIATAIVSVSTPGAYLEDGPDARALARRLNDYTAGLVRDHPGRFGFFATLTLPDVDGARAEAAYALDQLGADGVIVLANSAGVYPGDPSFAPLFEELGERGAAVFIHPQELPGPAVPGVPPFLADFLLDTTRAAISLARTGVLDRYPDLKVILSHAGGFLPYAAYRIAGIVHSPDGLPRGDQAAGLATLRRFWFDLALSATPAALPSLLAFADPARILYGTDWSYAPEPATAQGAAVLGAARLTDDQRHAIDRGNAETLLPRLRAAAPNR